MATIYSAMSDDSLYRRVSLAIDIMCLVGFPLGLALFVNYVLAIGVLAIIAVVTFLRRRFLDEKAAAVVEGVGPSRDHTGKDCQPVRVMTLAALLATVCVMVPLGIQLASGVTVAMWLVACLAVIWFGVAMVAVGRWLGRQ